MNFKNKTSPKYVFIDLRERERDINVRETLIGCLLYVPQQGSAPATYVCSQARDQTHNLSVHGMMLHPTELPGQGTS